jgi:hypothetical protein
MADTDTLYCELGQHEWQREKKRGKKPKSCPQHKPQVARTTMPPEEAARRRQEGRARAKAERDKDGIRRVLDYKAYLRRDVPLFMAFNNGDIERSEYIARRGPMPVIPNKADYDAAVLAGVHQGIVVDDEAA